MLIHKNKKYKILFIRNTKGCSSSTNIPPLSLLKLKFIFQL